MDRFNLINKRITGKDKDEGVVDSQILTFTKKKNNISDVVSEVKSLNPKDGDIFFVYLKDVEVDSGAVQSIRDMLSEAFEILRVNCLAIVLNFEVIIKKIPGSDHINIFFPENLSDAEKKVLSETITTKNFYTQPKDVEQKEETQPKTVEQDRRESLSGNSEIEKPLDLSVLNFKRVQAGFPPTFCKGL